MHNQTYPVVFFQMFSVRSLLQSLPSCGARLPMRPCVPHVSACPPSGHVSPLSTSAVLADDKVGSIWRLPRYDGNANAVWPNYQRHVTHHK